MNPLSVRASLAEKRGDYVIVGSDSETPSRPLKHRLGTPRFLNLRMNRFKTVLSVKARHCAHANVLEAEGYLLWLR